MIIRKICEHYVDGIECITKGGDSKLYSKMPQKLSITTKLILVFRKSLGLI